MIGESNARTVDLGKIVFFAVERSRAQTNGFEFFLAHAIGTRCVYGVGQSVFSTRNRPRENF